MARYIDVDCLTKMIEAKAETMLEGKEAFLYVARWLDLLPAAKVVEAKRVKWFYNDLCEFKLPTLLALANRQKIREGGREMANRTANDDIIEVSEERYNDLLKRVEEIEECLCEIFEFFQKEVE